MDFWTLDLHVELDRVRRYLTPHVRIGGGGAFRNGAVRVSLVGPEEDLRATTRHRLTPADVDKELRLASFPYGDAPAKDALRWGWDVTVETDGRERIRWRRYLESETAVGTDAELRLAGPPSEIRSKAEDEGWGPEAPWDERDSDRLLAGLVESGTITESIRTSAIAESVRSGSTVERILVDRGHLGEREMLERYAEVSGCELLDLEHYPIDPEAAEQIPEGVVRRCGLIGVGFHGDMLTVATSDPQNLAVLTAIKRFVWQPYIALATRADVLHALDRLTADA